MVAPDQEHGNLGLVEQLELLDDEKRGVEVAQCIIEQVAGDDQKINPFGHAEPHQVLKRGARRQPHPFHRRPRIVLQPAQGAVDVQIGRVSETHAKESSVPRRTRPKCIGL